MRALCLIALVCAAIGCAPQRPTLDESTRAAPSELATTAPSPESPALTGGPLGLPPPPAKEHVSAGDAAFAARLYKELRSGAGNLVFSPTSVRAALAMLSSGARGKTATELASALAFGPEGGQGERAFASQLRRQAIDDDNARVAIANGLWVRRDLPLERAFVDHLRDDYDAPAEPLDFVGAPDDARRCINGSIARLTKQKIPELLSPDMPLRETSLMLTNAIYLKAAWEAPFAMMFTTEEPFAVSPSRSVPAKMMHATIHAHYAARGDAVVLELRYAGDRLRMGIVLPKEGVGLASLESSLDEKSIAAWAGDLKPAEVALALPRFTIARAAPLADALKNIGVQRAFDGQQADFTGVVRQGGLYVKYVVHQALIAVSEQGTEAAASTAIGAELCSPRPPPIPVRADRPFLFYVRDTQTGALLFVGRLVDPSSRT